VSLRSIGEKTSKKKTKRKRKGGIRINCSKERGAPKVKKHLMVKHAPKDCRRKKEQRSRRELKPSE